MKVYNCILEEETNPPIRSDMLDALTCITNKYPEVLLSIYELGGKDYNLIRFYTVYGYTGEFDTLLTEFDEEIFAKLKPGDLSEDYWGPTSDIGDDWPWGTPVTSMLFYKGHFYKGHFEGKYTLGEVHNG